MSAAPDFKGNSRAPTSRYFTNRDALGRGFDVYENGAADDGDHLLLCRAETREAAAMIADKLNGYDRFAEALGLIEGMASRAAKGALA